MTSEQTAATVDALVAAWSAHDVDAVLECFAPDCVYEDVAAGLVLRGHDDLRAFATQVFASTPDLEYHETHRVVGERDAVVEYWLRGTPAVGLDGLPTNGTRGEVRCATVLEMRDGRIARNSDYWDANTLAKQLGGEVPPPS